MLKLILNKTYLLLVVFTFTGWISLRLEWLKEKHHGYTVYYQATDVENKDAYCLNVDNGIGLVRIFFKDEFRQVFDLYIHPSRQSLDSQWLKDWNIPNFKSECWMVASGVGNKLDLLSPRRWDMESCEHSYADKIHTQQLITHELFHVYHGQQNKSRDFSNTENIDWFVEGLATFGSGQFDSTKIASIKRLIAEKKVPATLDDFWKGKYKYSLSGSVVMFIDSKYGRSKLKELLVYNNKADILNFLRVSEESLLAEWKNFFGG